MSFDIEETIQSQYADSPVLTSLIKGLHGLISPEADIDLFYDSIFNIETAQGYGLDIWGKIVGINRGFVTGDSQPKYLGFEPAEGVENPDLGNFGNAVFYTPATVTTHKVADNSYRLLVMAKAMANISNGSLADMNTILSSLFPEDDPAVLKVSTMHLRFFIHDYITEWEKTALLNLSIIPAGVTYDLYQIDSLTFGFRGSDCEPFNQGVFSLGGTTIGNS